MQSYVSNLCGTVLYHLINCFIKILPYWFATKNMGNYRKYGIFFNFRFTENFFPSNAENQENTIFTLSVFTKMYFFMQCYEHLFVGFGVLKFFVLTKIHK